MDTRTAFARALRRVRKARDMSQEDFEGVASRAYVSALERAQKNPTLAMIDAMSEAMGVHPLTILLATYAAKHPRIPPEELMQTALAELQSLP
jgi:transcriptional regulator with XRE-family HTH domain